MKYYSRKDPMHEMTWLVEGYRDPNDDAPMLLVSFFGLTAQAHAEEYVTWKNSTTVTKSRPVTA